MDDVLFVTVIQGFQHFIHYLSDLVLGEDFGILSYLFKKLATWAELHNQIDKFNIVIGLIVLDYVWVVNKLEYRYFVIKILNLIFRELFLADDLDGYLVSDVEFVLAHEDLAEGASA